ncbi:reverse transcriptase domain-containing protein, partial [Tanacetum coccineum]
MIPATTLLLGFSREISWPLRHISLMVSVGDEEHSTSALMTFMVVRSPSLYNGVISRPGLRKIQAVPSTSHGMLKFPVKGGIVTLYSNTIIPTKCRRVAEAPGELPSNEPAVAEGIKVAIHPEYPEKTIIIGRSLSEKGRVELFDVLKNNLDIFAWRPTDMTGVSYPFKFFLDAYKGYHQIQMAEEDEEKTAFHTSQGVYCYTKMPFGFKNIGAMYQRLVDKAFKKQISRNLEVYIDDLVIKSHTEQEILRDIEETFHTLRKINMNLNPKNYTFVAEEGMFLDHVVNMKGIKTYKEKVEVVNKLQSSRTLKEIQSLMGKLASLNRFLSKSVEKSLPLFKTLKNCIKKAILNGRRGRKSVTGHETMHGGTTNGNLNKTQRRVDNLPLRSQRSKAFDITYRPRTSIRGQVLADVIAERPEEDGPPIGIQVEEAIPDPWTLFMDGSSCLEGLGAGLILTNPEGIEFTYAL